MEQLHITPLERARNSESAVLKVLNETKEEAIATSMGMTGGWLSKFKNNHLFNAIYLLRLAGFKVVPTEMKCFDPEEIESIFQMAKRYMSDKKSAEDLRFDDPE